MKGRRPLTRLPGPPDPKRFVEEQDIDSDGLIAFAINSNERNGITLEQIDVAQGDSKQINSIDLPSNIGRSVKNVIEFNRR